MMIDFMDRDDQEMIRIQEEFLAKAAKHQSIRCNSTELASRLD